MGDGAKARGVYEDAVEFLCRNIEELGPLVAPAVWDAAFPLVRDADPAGAAWRDAVRTLHDAVEAAGVPNGLGLPATMGRTPGWRSSPTPQSVGWVCPTDRCGRIALRHEPSDPTPACAVAGVPMRLVDG